jgi:catechol 2,3-dioxygenase-like lactoylglutathione lyase family enzyme
LKTGGGLGEHREMTTDSGALFTRLAPVLNVEDLAAERAFYERLGLPVIYEGTEYPDFIAFGTDTVHFGIQAAPGRNDPPSVLTWQIGVTDVDQAAEVCRAAGIDFDHGLTLAVPLARPRSGWVQ